MGDSATKHLPVITDINSLTNLLKTRRSKAFIYGFMFAFVSFTVFLAFNPSPNTYAPWFSNIFTVNSNLSSSTSNSTYIFPNSSSSVQASKFTSDGSDKATVLQPNSTVNDSSLNEIPKPINHTNTSQTQKKFTKAENLKPNQTKSGVSDSDSDSTHSQQNLVKAETLKPNQTKSGATDSNSTQSQQNLVKGEILKPNQIEPGAPRSEAVVDGRSVNGTGKMEKGIQVNDTASLSKEAKEEKKQGKKADGGIESLLNCELFDGEWVKDDSYPLYEPGSCSVIDESFNCITNGRPDKGYQKYKWKPHGCNLPRLDASRMLEMLRGKRLVFVGDSLNRNMWESLVCILKSEVKDKKKVYEASGRHHFRGEASYSFVFKDYNCTVEFYVTPFLVQEWEMMDKNGSKKETLRLDLVGKSSNLYKGADYIVFNTGHWWTHDKTSKGEDYYQEGSHVYKELNVLEAFRKALTTWSRWVDANVNTGKSLIFFRGYSESHFSGGQWNSGGACDHEVEPIKNNKYLRSYPSKMIVLEKVLKGMKTPVKYLNVTRMTDYRKDGHPSMYRKRDMAKKDSVPQMHVQDCSHWCLPGVPDTWNEILYAELLIQEFQKQQTQKVHR